KVHQYNVFSTFTPGQYAFAAMLQADPAHYEGLGAFYQAKRDRFRAQLAGTRLRPLPVPGGYFQLVDYSDVRDLDDARFCRWLTVEKGAAAIPLSPFYDAPPSGLGLARLCVATNEGTLDAALERLRRPWPAAQARERGGYPFHGPSARLMGMDNLRISLVQGATRWHDPDGNREYYGDLIAPLRGITDVVLLPETFTSGFSNEAIGRAETMDGPTVAWMRDHAQRLDAAVCGSVQLRVDDAVFNRLLWVTPDGGLQHYDKRHLFRY